uniref:C-type lectin domain-containing protein n=2 Tax=Ciona intestinalis TaxID=7719 RepID=F6WXX0_CIOIN
MSKKREAADYCYSQGGGLVDIVNKEMYDLVYHYASVSITTSSPYGTFYVWLAMLYTSEDQLVRQSNGGPVSYVRWHLRSGEESIIWTVADHNHPNVEYTGYWTNDGDYDMGFPLCTKYMG